MTLKTLLFEMDNELEEEDGLCSLTISADRVRRWRNAVAKLIARHPEIGSLATFPRAGEGKE